MKEKLNNKITIMEKGKIVKISVYIADGKFVAKCKQEKNSYWRINDNSIEQLALSVAGKCSKFTNFRISFPYRSDEKIEMIRKDWGITNCGGPNLLEGLSKQGIRDFYDHFKTWYNTLTVEKLEIDTPAE